MRTQAVLDAIEVARHSRGTTSRAWSITPMSGTPFTSLRYGERLPEVGAAPSIG